MITTAFCFSTTSIAQMLDSFQLWWQHLLCVDWTFPCTNIPRVRAAGSVCSSSTFFYIQYTTTDSSGGASSSVQTPWRSENVTSHWEGCLSPSNPPSNIITLPVTIVCFSFTQMSQLLIAMASAHRKQFHPKLKLSVVICTEQNWWRAERHFCKDPNTLNTLYNASSNIFLLRWYDITMI